MAETFYGAQWWEIAAMWEERGAERERKRLRGTNPRVRVDADGTVHKADALWPASVEFVERHAEADLARVRRWRPHACEGVLVWVEDPRGRDVGAPRNPAGDDSATDAL